MFIKRQFENTHSVALSGLLGEINPVNVDVEELPEFQGLIARRLMMKALHWDIK